MGRSGGTGGVWEKGFGFSFVFALLLRDVEDDTLGGVSLVIDLRLIVFAFSNLVGRIPDWERVMAICNDL